MVGVVEFRSTISLVFDLVLVVMICCYIIWMNSVCSAIAVISCSVCGCDGVLI